MSQSKICAVVVTYNRLELLKLCIESLKKQTRSLDEILIINNSSTDGTEEWLKKQNDLVFITQENTGGAGGFHTGIKTAYEKGFDWIWCMDDDTFPKLGCLQNLCNEIDISFHSQIGFLCSKVLNQSGSISTLNKPGKFYPQKRWRPLPDYNYSSRVDVASFVSVLLNKLAVSKVGLPNPNYFIYLDDVEYTTKFNCFTNLYVPTSIAFHGTLKQEQKYYDFIVHGNYCYFWIRNMIWFYKKNNVWYLVKSIVKYFLHLFKSIYKEKKQIKKIALSIQAVIDGLFKIK